MLHLWDIDIHLRCINWLQCKCRDVFYTVHGAHGYCLGPCQTFPNLAWISCLSRVHWPLTHQESSRHRDAKNFCWNPKTFSKHMLSFLKLSLSPGTLDFLIRVFRKAPFIVISFPQPRNPIKSTKKAKREALREVPRAMVPTCHQIS